MEVNDGTTKNRECFWSRFKAKTGLQADSSVCYLMRAAGRVCVPLSLFCSACIRSGSGQQRRGSLICSAPQRLVLKAGEWLLQFSVANDASLENTGRQKAEIGSRAANRGVE